MQKLYKGIILAVMSLNLILVCVSIALVLLKTPKTHPNQGLFLSPLIKQGQHNVARKLSKVNYSKFFFVESYSGYLTVDDVTNTHLFFWYFPAAESPIQAPVILWLNGEPETSSLYGLFLEIGPFCFNSAAELQLRKHSWHKQYNLLFIDNPLGVGFSKTAEKVPKNVAEIGRNLYAAMEQFFKVFPELVSNDFYIGGVSYAGKYITALGHTIHVNNQEVKQKINLKGLLIGNGFIDPINQINYADYLYQQGMYDERESELIRKEQNKCIDLIANNSYAEAMKVFSNMVVDRHELSHINLFNYLRLDNIEPAEPYIEQFLNQKDVKQAIHVDDDDYQLTNQLIAQAFKNDLMQSVVSMLSELLSHYRVLLFVGQLDVLCAYPLIHNYIIKMNFSGSEEFKNAPRVKWHVGEELAGYFKSGGNLAEVMVRNSGHSVTRDQPLLGIDMVNRFILNKTFY